MNEYFDGEDRRACQQGEEACDVCSPSADLQRAIAGITEAASEQAVQGETGDDGESATACATGVVSFRGTDEVSVDRDDVQAFRELQRDCGRAKEADVERTRDEQAQTRQIKSRLEEWRGKCVLCAIHGRAFDHSAWRCEHVQSYDAYAMARLAQKSTKLEGKFSCTMCFTPQSMCHWFVPHASKAGWYLRSVEDGRSLVGEIAITVCCEKNVAPHSRAALSG